MNIYPEMPPAQARRADIQTDGRDAATRAAAQQFEAVILAEMLRAAGAGEVASEFGGGIGEEQFASFLINAQAERIAARGGLGIAEMTIRALSVQDAAK